jgi:hypothetical protein
MAEHIEPEPTLYVILQATASEGGTWDEVGSIGARSTDHAIRQYFSRRETPNGKRVVAIPARSFQPVTLKVETQTVIKLQPATSQDTQ